MKAYLLGFLVSVGILAAVPAFAHHPFSAEYDSKKPVTITGTVTKVDWTNPHAFLMVDQKDTSGQITNWKIELGGPGALTRRGWHRNSVKAGDQVTVEGWMAKDGSKHANAKDVALADGHKLNAASSYYDKAEKSSSH